MKLAALEKDIGEYLREHKIKLLHGKRMKCPPSGTILRWASENLIPSPTGGTRYAAWPGWSWEQTIAAAYLLGKEGWSRGRLCSARVHIGLALEAGRLVTTELDQLWDEDSRYYLDAVSWVLLVLKAHSGWPLESPATIIAGLDEHTRTPQYLAMPPIQKPGEHPVAVDRIVRGDTLGG